MQPYEIEFQPSVRKDFRKLSPDNASRILPKIEELATDPLNIVGVASRKRIVPRIYAKPARYLGNELGAVQ